MKLAIGVVLLLVGHPLAVLAQTPGWRPARVPVASCTAADSLLGPAPKQVLKAQVYGTLGPGAAFELRSGPISGSISHTLQLTSRTADQVALPSGYVTAWFPPSVLRASAAQAEPIQLILEQSDTLPLGTPNLPTITGRMPPAVPFTVVMRARDALALVRAQDARLAFVGKQIRLTKGTLAEFQAAFRLGVCQMAADSSARAT